jgi:Domain of unknown function (DUF4399)
MENNVMASIRTGLVALAVFALASVWPAAAQTPSPAGARVYFINLKDGAEVTSPFLVQFGLSGMGVAPAGVEKPNTGHHHLLIDTKLTEGADSGRRHAQAFRRRPDRSDGDLAARKAHVATGARRLVAHSVFAAGDVGADHDHGEIGVFARGREGWSPLLSLMLHCSAGSGKEIRFLSARQNETDARHEIC